MPNSRKPNRFYVYTLSDPRDGVVFYVGKGTGRRMYQHEADCRRGAVGNAVKHQRIRSILDEGRQVVATVVASDLLEDAALRRERELIASYGLSALVNVAPGAMTSLERSKLRASALLSSLKPFSVWLAERCRSEIEIATAQGVREALTYIARHGSITEMRLSAGVIEYR